MKYIIYDDILGLTVNLARISNYKPNTQQRIVIFLLLIYVLYISDIARNALNWVADTLWDASPRLSISTTMAVGVLAIYSATRFTRKKRAESRSGSDRVRWTLWGLTVLLVALLALVAAIALLI